MGNRGKQKKGSRNAPCRCGSGKKYKNCCGKNSGKGGSPIIKTPPQDIVPAGPLDTFRQACKLSDVLDAEERYKERLTWGR